MAENCELCHEHSGIKTYLQVITALSSLAAAMLVYSSLWQVPTMKADIAKEIARMEARDQEIKADLALMKNDIKQHDGRIAKLEK